MKNKLTRNEFFSYSLLGMFLLALAWSFTYVMHFPGDVPLTHVFGMFHTVFNVVTIVGWIVFVILLFCNWVDGDNKVFDKCFMSEHERKYGKYDNNKDNKEEVPVKKPFKFRWWIVGFLLFIFLCYTYGFAVDVFNGSVKIFNQSKKYQNEYTKKVQEKRGFYDKLWKTYYQKEKIVNLNTQTFTAITKLIMENRKDGANLSWKWVQENQQIPFDKFSDFYADLSNFITSQREGYFNIELVCQEIANKNNTMLDTFPNNYYNKIVGCPRIKFEYGFTSDSTEKIFTTKRENLK